MAHHVPRIIQNYTKGLAKGSFQIPSESIYLIRFDVSIQIAVSADEHTVDRATLSDSDAMIRKKSLNTNGIQSAVIEACLANRTAFVSGTSCI